MCSELSKVGSGLVPSCYYYVNIRKIGHKHHSWADMAEYGFVSAGGGRKYSDRLNQLKVGHKIFVYQKANGYVGYGRVTSPKVLAEEFELSDGRGMLLDQKLEHDDIGHHRGDRDLAEYVVGVEWIDTRSSKNAVGVCRKFTRRHIVCRILKPDLEDFLTGTFRDDGR